MESTVNSVNEKEKKVVEGPRVSRVPIPMPELLSEHQQKMTTDKATYNADGSLASLASTYSLEDPRGGADIPETPVPCDDAWDDVNLLRKALKVNSRGYLATTAAVVIGACFLASVAVGTVLAMPVVVLVTTWKRVNKLLLRRTAKKEATSNLRVVPGSEGE